MQTDLISVIMTCYNEEIIWVEESISSILEQSHKNFEFIIVLDNTNNKELEELILRYEKKDNRIIFIKNESNRGLVYSLNRGLSIAKGEFIARMDADDISWKNRFEVQYNFLKDNEDISLVSVLGDIVDTNKNVLYTVNPLGVTSSKAKESLKYRNVFFHSGWMFRATILRDLEGYKDLPRTEDLDFLCRLILNNYNVVNIPQPLISIRVRENGITNSNNYEQILVARLIMFEYKEALDKNKVYSPMDKIDNISFDKADKEKYSIACKLYIEALSNYKQKKYLKFFWGLSKCMLISNEKRRDMISTIKIKFINKGFK